jgi:N-acetylmuramoyl-L-alanine amidase
VIDAGHGGKDPGCHGKKYKEKDVALAVALQLGKYIEENIKNVKVVYTRKTDVFVELQERAEIANRAKADLFICIHCNSACYRDKKTRRDICKEEVEGAETYVMGIKNEQGKLDVAQRENSAILLEDNYVSKYNGFDPNSAESYIIMSMFTDKYLDQSLNFASKIQNQYSNRIGRHDKGVKRASLWVLWRTYMPSVLTEIGFLTNPEEEEFLGSEKGQDYIASGLFRAFREYKDELDGSVKKYNDIFENQVPPKKEDTVLTPVTPKKEEPLEDKKNKIVKESEAKLADSLPKEKNEEVKKEVKESKKEIKVENDYSKIIYKIQILSSDKKIPLNSTKFKGLEKMGMYIDKGVYKYTVGEFDTTDEATKMQLLLRKNEYKDAFMIATQNGKRIPMK